MKKLALIFMVLCFLFAICLTACGGQDDEPYFDEPSIEDVGGNNGAEEGTGESGSNTRIDDDSSGSGQDDEIPDSGQDGTVDDGTAEDEIGDWSPEVML